MENERFEPTGEEKAQRDALLGLFSHPGWQIYQMAAEETLFTLMQAYFNFNLKETVDGKQRFKSNEQLVVEQVYLRGRIDQLKDTLYVYHEGAIPEERLDSYRAGVWERTIGLFRRLLWD